MYLSYFLAKDHRPYFYVSLMSMTWLILNGLCYPHFSPQAMVKLSKRLKDFVNLVYVGMHLIECNPGSAVITLKFYNKNSLSQRDS